MDSFGPEDPQERDVRALQAEHLAFARGLSPGEHVHALDVDGLADPAVTLYGLRRDGVLLGVGALKRLDDTHVEVKSMHVGEAARGQGLGRAIVEHLLAVAAEQGFRRISLETGTMDAFAPARALYASSGFEPCAPFGAYTVNPYSTCMTRELAVSADVDPPAALAGEAAGGG